MPLHDFHPAVARWFAERLGEPTAVQQRGWEAIRAGRNALISAPTGSGKTLAAFLIEIDLLLRESLAGSLAEETRVLYVSPLKALSADIHRNLAEPRREIRRLAEEMGFGSPRITSQYLSCGGVRSPPRWRKNQSRRQSSPAVRLNQQIGGRIGIEAMGHEVGRGV